MFTLRESDKEILDICKLAVLYFYLAPPNRFITRTLRKLEVFFRRFFICIILDQLFY